jgi:hypothetical protein
LICSVEYSGLGQTPTAWQRSQHPVRYQDMISIMHEGIDTNAVHADAAAVLEVDGITLTRADEVITYAARNLEPYRGFHVFMRALPAILKTPAACARRDCRRGRRELRGSSSRWPDISP